MNMNVSLTDELSEFVKAKVFEWPLHLRKRSRSRGAADHGADGRGPFGFPAQCVGGGPGQRRCRPGRLCGYQGARSGAAEGGGQITWERFTFPGSRSAIFWISGSILRPTTVRRRLIIGSIGLNRGSANLRNFPQSGPLSRRHCRRCANAGDCALVGALRDHEARRAYRARRRCRAQSGRTGLIRRVKLALCSVSRASVLGTNPQTILRPNPASRPAPPAPAPARRPRRCRRAGCAGPSDSRSDIGCRSNSAALLLGEAAFRADQQRRSPRRGMRALSQRLRPDRSDVGRLVAEHQQPVGIARCRDSARAPPARRPRRRSRMPHCSAASIALARIRSRLTRETCVCRVSTGCSAEAPISTAFCTM